MCVATLLFGRMWHDFVIDMNNNATTTYDYADEPKIKNEYDYVNATDINKKTEVYCEPKIAFHIFVIFNSRFLYPPNSNFKGVAIQNFLRF